MFIDKAYIFREFYKVCILLNFIHIFILLLWLLYLTKRLIVSNKILRGTMRHESASETQYSVYNARTQVIKNRFLVGILAIEIITAILPALVFYIFAKKEVIWNVGQSFVNESIPVSNATNSCMVDYRIIAIYNYPYIFLLPALTGVSFLILLSLLSIHTYFLEMRYKICHYKRGALKLAIMGLTQSILLIAMCFSRFTVLFEPLLFGVFFLYDFFIYTQLVRSLKLTLKGRLLELYTFKDCALRFDREQREHRKYVIFTFLFCFALLIPSIVFHIDLYFYLLSFTPSCIFKIFFSFEHKMSFPRYNKSTDPAVHTLLNLNPFFLLVPLFLSLLPHFAFMVYWYVDRTARRKKCVIINAEITKRLI